MSVMDGKGMGEGVWVVDVWVSVDGRRFGWIFIGKHWKHNGYGKRPTRNPLETLKCTT